MIQGSKGPIPDVDKGSSKVIEIEYKVLEASCTVLFLNGEPTVHLFLKRESVRIWYWATARHED